MSQSTYSTSENCKDCKSKDEHIQILNARILEKYEKVEAITKELELLTRRHEIIKSKYNDINKDNSKVKQEEPIVKTTIQHKLGLT